jgi:hypothetical protein
LKVIKQRDWEKGTGKVNKEKEKEKEKGEE